MRIRELAERHSHCPRLAEEVEGLERKSAGYLEQMG